jgi:hypothetical protein
VIQKATQRVLAPQSTLTLGAMVAESALVVVWVKVKAQSHCHPSE